MKKYTPILAAVAATMFSASYSAWATPTLTTLATFNGTNGNIPGTALIADSAGDLFSTTQTGGTANYGTVFELPAGTHTITTLANFTGPPSGQDPMGDLIADSNGNLYGTTRFGGTSNWGTIFEVAAGTHTLSTPVNFTGFNGEYPQAGMISDSNGNLYGTTNQGGINGYGNVFKFSPSTSTLTTLTSFTNTDGEYPESDLISDAAGNFYGTTNIGGASNQGTVFKLSPGSSTPTTLATFNGTNGSYPMGGLVADSGGNLYGTTVEGGDIANDPVGTVFEIAAGTNTLTTIATLSNNTGIFPYSGLIIDAAGDLFGTTTQGGAGHFGTVFEIAAGTHAFSLLATFGVGGTVGAYPQASLLADSAGNLYGTTISGGPDNDGTIFEITNTGFVVPEPTSLSLLALAVPALLTRRRRNLASRLAFDAFQNREAR